jgi:hypothetical protein
MASAVYYQALDARWISREQADGALLLRVNSIDGAAIVGKEGKPGDYSGIVIAILSQRSLQHVNPGRIKRDWIRSLLRNHVRAAGGSSAEPRYQHRGKSHPFTSCFSAAMSVCDASPIPPSW